MDGKNQSLPFKFGLSVNLASYGDCTTNASLVFTNNFDAAGAVLTFVSSSDDSSSKTWLWIAIAVVVVVLVGIGAYFFFAKGGSSETENGDEGEENY